ncbi:RING-type E3 ubiquitin transferase [Salvia divinorum]|uniref:RING-type E3 ubiquitin transferase n=1 Tax=Salvia divinorum TaxID=28513 RepID=A0ABD1GPX7_SALDI
MDDNSWATRLSSASKRYQSALQSRSEMLMGFEEIDMDDDIREEYPCPFCSDYFDIVGLCCHIDDEHPIEAKNGVCPICTMRSLFAGSSCIVSSSNAAPDPLLSSFILPMVEDYESVPSHSSAETTIAKKSTTGSTSERKPPMSVKDQEEKTKRSDFVQGLLLSVMFDDNS